MVIQQVERHRLQANATAEPQAHWQMRTQREEILQGLLGTLPKEGATLSARLMSIREVSNMDEQTLTELSQSMSRALAARFERR